MILAIVAWLWFWLQLCLSSIVNADLGDGSNYSVIVMWQWFLRYCLLPRLILVMAPIILWLSCGNDSCKGGLIVILVTTWPIAYCLLPRLILVMAPIILWLSCGNDSCDSGLIVILVTTWPIAHQQDGSGQSDTTHAKSKKKKEQKILIDQAKRTRAT